MKGKKIMKKALSFILIATVLLLSGCFMSKKSQTTPVAPGASENVQASNAPTASPAQTNEKKAETSENKTATSDKKSEASDKKDGLIKAEGAFLGMDDSNSLVIIEKSGDKVAEQRYQILKELNFENSNIEIGQSVEFTYKTEKNGVKTIQKISKK
jgi:hypothetical protein